MRDTELSTRLEDCHVDAFGWALSCCDWDRTTAEDVLQTTYLKVLNGKAVFGGRSSFKTWLFGVIRKTAAEHRRSQALRRFVPLVSASERSASGAPDPVSRLVLAERNEQLVAALRRLPRRQQEVLHLVFFEEMTIEGAAEVLGVSLGTARTHYERGKTRLRGLLSLED
jgi:RNA polymerase sigma-70 factor (ECF subfamily)